MKTFNSKISAIKPVFSGHETFPLRYGWLKKVYDEVSIAVNEGKNPKEVFNSDDAIALFGVGKNMVSSMRYWATWTGVIDYPEQRLSYFKDFMLDNESLDPWLESPISLWLLHWQLVSNPKLLTYYWFFNYFNGTFFDREQLYLSIMTVCKDNSLMPPSNLTLKRDVDCFIRTYVSKIGKNEKLNEDSLDSLLPELNLIERVSRRDSFQINRGKKSSLTPGVFLVVLLEFWENNWKNQSTLSLEATTYDPGSPGRIFLLDEEAVYEFAQVLTTLGVGIEWSEVAGIRQFHKRIIDKEVKENAISLIKNEYGLRK